MSVDGAMFSSSGAGSMTRVGGDETVLEFKNGCFQWRNGGRTSVKIDRQGVRVGCKLVTWEAWDEIKRLVGGM